MCQYLDFLHNPVTNVFLKKSVDDVIKLCSDKRSIYIPNRPVDFNVTSYEAFIDMVLDSVL